MRSLRSYFCLIQLFNLDHSENILRTSAVVENIKTINSLSIFITQDVKNSNAAHTPAEHEAVLFSFLPLESLGRKLSQLLVMA